jgi:hypothetical protein
MVRGLKLHLRYLTFAAETFLKITDNHVAEMYIYTIRWLVASTSSCIYAKPPSACLLRKAVKGGVYL